MKKEVSHMKLAVPTESVREHGGCSAIMKRLVPYAPTMLRIGLLMFLKIWPYPKRYLYGEAIFGVDYGARSPWHDSIPPVSRTVPLPPVLLPDGFYILPDRTALCFVFLLCK